MEAFDETTGQVYREEISARVTSMVPTWMYQARNKSVDPSMYRHCRNGASSLQEMALRSCAWNAHLFMPETLQYAGWHYANKVYKHLKDT